MPSLPGTKRLSDKDVKEIFACLHETGKRPSEHLTFQIVPVGPNGLKLSPPSHEFEDGLYVLLKPQPKKKSTTQIPQAPPHLQDLVMTSIPPENCAWSLSGPQFPVNNKAGSLQQRYCYPKGRPEYSSYKGGALWTIRGPDGKEDSDYRLLHVYQSQKRASNKGLSGVPSTTESTSSASYYQPVAKKARYISPSRERLLPTRYRGLSQKGIYRINSSASLCTTPTLDTSLSFPTLDDGAGLSQSFESFQGCVTSGQGNSGPGYLEHLDADFSFPDLVNDPLFQEMNQQSNEAKLSMRLYIIHDKIRKFVLEQPHEQQASFVHIIAAWARDIAADPLRAHNEPEEENYANVFEGQSSHQVV